MASTALLLREQVKSSAYVPFFVSIWLADGRGLTAWAVAFGVPLVVIVLKNAMSRFLA